MVVHQPTMNQKDWLNVIVPQDWTDHAEFIWRLASAGKTQAEIAEILGWSRGQVSQYQMLSKICADAWQVVVATTKSAFVAKDSSGIVADSATTVAKTFTEGLLRHVVSLTAGQQLALVKDLAAERTECRQTIESQEAPALFGGSLVVLSVQSAATSSPDPRRPRGWGECESPRTPLVWPAQIPRFEHGKTRYRGR